MNVETVNRAIIIINTYYLRNIHNKRCTMHIERTLIYTQDIILGGERKAIKGTHAKLKR